MAYSAELYVHDLDRQAADALNQFPKFTSLDKGTQPFVVCDG